MIRHGLVVICLALMALTGCTSHLMFVEESHVGLKAQFAPNNPSPAEISVGYRRGVVAVIPQQSDEPKTPTNSVTVATEKGNDGKTKVTILNDPNELMSLYSVFQANVGFGDPIEVRHFLATGIAAASLLSNQQDLKDVGDRLKQLGFGEGKGD